MENIAPNRRAEEEAAARKKPNLPAPPRTVAAARSADHYARLGVRRDASSAEIRRAYHRLVFSHHPDKVDRALTAKGSSDGKLGDIDVAGDIDIDTDDDSCGLELMATGIATRERERDCVSAHGSTSSIPRNIDTSTYKVLVTDSNEADYHSTMFSLISDAYNVLRDRVLRTEYDMEQGFVDRSDANIAALHLQQRVQAQKDIELMHVTYESRRAAEEECRGVVVVSAVYGSLENYVNTRRSIGKSASGPTLDVTVQVQCAIDASTLYVEGGVSKAAALRGLFNPCVSETSSNMRGRKNFHCSDGASVKNYNLRLCVRYLFRGKQHQVSVGDHEELKIPMRSHQLATSQQFKIRRRKKRKSLRDNKNTTASHMTVQRRGQVEEPTARKDGNCGTHRAEVIQADGEKNHKTTQPFTASTTADPSLHKQNMEGAYVPGPDVWSEGYVGEECTKDPGAEAGENQPRSSTSLSFVFVVAAVLVFGVYITRQKH